MVISPIDQEDVCFSAPQRVCRSQARKTTTDDDDARPAPDARLR
jgi:hypothetical protein